MRLRFGADGPRAEAMKDDDVKSPWRWFRHIKPRLDWYPAQEDVRQIERERESNIVYLGGLQMH